MSDYDDIIREKRPISYRNAPMDRKHRAKQFMAFDALKGYGEAVKKQERIYMPDEESSSGWREETGSV